MIRVVFRDILLDAMSKRMEGGESASREYRRMLATLQV